MYDSICVHNLLQYSRLAPYCYTSYSFSNMCSLSEWYVGGMWFSVAVCQWDNK